MTYYGYRIWIHVTFACGHKTKLGGTYQKFLYQYAGLGAPQRCKRCKAEEVSREIERIDGPHGDYALGWWKRQDGTRIFLQWEPATGCVTLCDQTEGRYPVDWHRERLVKVPEAVLRRLLGDDWGGERAGPAEEILQRLRSLGRAGSSGAAEATGDGG